MMKLFRRILFTSTLLCFIVSTAQAQRPFFTDDADVTPRGHFHFAFSNEFDLLQRSSFPNLKQNAAGFEIGYGLFEGVEIGIGSPLLSLFNAAGTVPKTPSGIGDTGLSVKYNFHKESENSRLPAMTIGINVGLPTGDTQRQLGSGLTDFSANGILQKSLSKKTTLRLNGDILFTGNTEVGVIGIKTRGTVVAGSVELVEQFTPKFDFGVEWTGALTKTLQLGAGQFQTVLGGNYQFRKNATFDCGVVVGKYAASPRAGVILGISVDW